MVVGHLLIRSLGQTLLVAFLVLAGIRNDAVGQDAQPVQSLREITPISGGLYQVRDGSQVTVFLVTSDGIVLADPLSRPTALWLKGELAARFPNQPVLYVLPSHVSFFRLDGVAVFTGADVIAQEIFLAEWKARKVLPPETAALDQNHNGTLEGHEFIGTPLAAVIAARDQNGDGVVTPAELYRSAPYVKGTYRTRRTLVLGDQGDETVQLIHPGPFGGPEMTVLFFPSERLVFAVNPPPLGEVPFSMPATSSPRELREWFHTMADLDFDVLLTGSGETFTRSAIVAVGKYLDDLWDGVVAGFEAGRTVGQLQSSALLAEYQTDPRFGGRNADIALVYRRLHVVRVDAYATAGLSFATHNPDYCTPAPALAPYMVLAYDTCTGAGGWVPSSTLGLSISNGRFAVVIEARLAGQIASARTSPLYDDAVAHRDTLGSVLFRHDIRSTGPVRYSGLLGVSGALGRTTGYLDLKGGVAPTAGYYPVVFSSSRPGVTAGADVVHPIARRVSVTVPIRVTWFVSGRPTGLSSVAYVPPQRPIPAWPGSLDVHIGIGLTYRLSQVVN